MEGRGRRRWQWLLCAAWLVACVACSVAAVASPYRPLEIAPGVGEVALSPHVTWRHDPNAFDRPEDAWRHLVAGDFEPLPGGDPAFGFQRGAFWFHVQIDNRDPGETRWLLVQAYPLSDRIDLYVRHPDGSFSHRASGDTLPFSSRAVAYRHPNFLLDLPVGTPVDLLVQVRSQSSMQVPLVLYTPTRFAEVSRDAQFAIGAYYGILLALFVYNLVLWLALRDSGYFWYLFHISAFGLVLFCLNGLGFEYLWPGNPWLADKSVPLSISLALVGMHQFARVFLGLRERWPLGNRVSVGAIALFVCFGIAALFLPYRAITPVVSLAVLVSIVWITVATVVVLRSGYAPARLFLLSWAMFLFGTAVFTLVAFGMLPKVFFTEYGVQIGSALEMLFLSIALSHRYGALREENIRITQESQQKLERKVAQRTREVRAALVQLEEANRLLSESNRRDGLTGLYNRSFFHQAFERMLADARADGTPLSVLLLDLDHFKSINDHHGHLAGDACLRAAATRIDAALGRTDLAADGGGAEIDLSAPIVARFGGEEFVVALPGHDLRQAVVVAESLRRAIGDAPVATDEGPLRISASVGVHTLDPDGHDDADDALKVADQALYAAKANGRDCVRTSLSAA